MRFIQNKSVDIIANSNAAVIGEVGDAAADISSTAIMSVGDSFQGSLSVVGDKDWVAIELVSGETYDIELNGIGGNSVSDPYLRIYDEDGNLLTFNDDGGPGLNSALSFTALNSGLFYIEADSYFNNKIGDYQIDVAIGTPPVPATPTDSLIWGGADFDESQVITVFFALAGTTVSDEGDLIVSDGFTQIETDAIMGMFGDVSDFANITFQQTNDQANADIRLATDDLGGSLLGFMNPQGFTVDSDGLGVFTSNSTYWNAASLARGGFMYSVIVHELGHGLGLAHTHDNGGGSDVMTGVSGSGDTGEFGEMNQTLFTIMSYNDSWNGHPLGAATDFGSGYMSTFGALDISVLQSYYGANANHNLGKTIYTLGSEEFYKSIWDSGGNDKIVVSNGTDAVIDLRAATLDYEVGGGGYASYTAGTRGGFTIANGVVIEKAIGSSGNDTITGNDVKNTLKGKSGTDTIDAGAGRDKILGGRGDDVLTGGDGDDKIIGGSGADRFIFDLDDGTDEIKRFSEKDVVDLSGLGLVYADLAVSITGSTAVVSFGSTVLNFVDLKADLGADDFIF